LSQYDFDDWRNTVVSFGCADCYSAVYSRPDEAYIVLANLSAIPANVRCQVNPGALSHPISSVRAATLTGEDRVSRLDPAMLTDAGQEIPISATTALLIHLRSTRM
jgi:hypothetical protein